MGLPEGVAGSKIQLLMAIASERPLAALQPGRSMPAGEFFERVLAEASRSGQSLAVAVRYFRLER